MDPWHVFGFWSGYWKSPRAQLLQCCRIYSSWLIDEKRDLKEAGAVVLVQQLARYVFFRGLLLEVWRDWGAHRAGLGVFEFFEPMQTCELCQNHQWKQILWTRHHHQEERALVFVWFKLLWGFVGGLIQPGHVASQSLTGIVPKASTSLVDTFLKFHWLPANDF